MSDKQESLALRREVLKRICAEQRDQLALQVHASRAPLDGSGGHPGGVLGTVAGKLLSGRYKVPVLVASAVAGGLLLKRTRARGFSAERLLGLWQTAQPILAMIRKARGG